MSFLLDPPLIAAAGATAEHIAPGDPALQRKLRAATVGSFVGISLALYANAPGISRVWPKLGARSGREFMVTSGLAEIDESRMDARHHAGALALFLLYPAWYEMGRALRARMR